MPDSAHPAILLVDDNLAMPPMSRLGHLPAVRTDASFCSRSVIRHALPHTVPAAADACAPCYGAKPRTTHALTPDLKARVHPMD